MHNNPIFNALRQALRSLFSNTAQATEDASAMDSSVVLAARLKQFTEGNSTILMVSGVGPGDGTTGVAVGVSRALAAISNGNILLIDTNFHTPSVYEYLGLKKDPGLYEVLNNTSNLNEVLQRTELSNLTVLTTGEISSTEEAINRLSSNDCVRFFASLKPHFEIIVIDAPAIVSCSESSILALRSDGVLLVAGKGQRHLREINAANTLLHVLNCNIIGIVLTQQKSSESYKNGE